MSRRPRIVDRIQGDRAAPIGPPPVVGHDRSTRTDAKLAKFAEFTVTVESLFGLPGNGYDSKRHRYRASYIRPKSFSLRLEARTGLPVALRRMASPGSRRPATLDEFASLVAELDNGDIGTPGGDGVQMIPDELIAYQWIVKERGGKFVSSKLVQRPVSPMQLAVFEVPRAGSYDITLRAKFEDNRQGEQTVRVDINDWFIVSLGDSAASGQGNPDRQGTVDMNSPRSTAVCEFSTISLARGYHAKMNNDPVWTEKLAYRSMKSGPALAARAVQHIFESTWDTDGKSKSTLTFDKVVFASFARSGAKIDVGLFDPQKGKDDFIGTGQLEECERTANGRPIDAMMISIGGNDLGFAGVLSDLVTGDSVFRMGLRFFDTGDDAGERERIGRRLDAALKEGGYLDDAYDRLERRLDKLRKNPGLKEVYIAGYPASIFEVNDKEGKPRFKACGVFSGPDLDLSGEDGKAIKLFGTKLNAAIKRNADKHHWHFVDVDNDFAGHGYCADESSTFWVGAEDSCKRQGDFEGMAHPNYRGHQAYALRLSQAMRTHTFGGA